MIRLQCKEDTLQSSPGTVLVGVGRGPGTVLGVDEEAFHRGHGRREFLVQQRQPFRNAWIDQADEEASSYGSGNEN